MFRKFLLISFVALLAAFVVVDNSLAQGAPVRGVVKVKKADGTEAPVAEAIVDAYRMDLGRGTMHSAKTNKRGEFSFVQFPLGQTFALAVSGPGIGPRVEPGVKGGNENIVIIVSEGDGRKLTEAEVREVVASAAKAPAGGGGESAEDKKKREELEKKNAEIIEKNKKIQEGDAVARKANEDGVAALKAKDYNTAIAKFSEGVAAVPDFVGSTPVMLNGKMVALRARGYEAYREGAANTDAAARKAKYEQANKDYDEGLAAFTQAMAVIKAAPAATDPNEQKTRANITLELLTNAVEIHRLKAVGGVDTTKGAEAKAVIEEYLAAETDPVKKAKTEMTLGDILRENGDCEGAIAAYKKILERSADDVDALAGAGLCMFSVGYGNSDKAQMQEGLNLMTRFSELAPDTHKLKTSVKDAVDLLKNEQKLTPQKAPAKRKT
jgi:tetratricopeptide (TPR) repeat protein